MVYDFVKKMRSELLNEKMSWSRIKDFWKKLCKKNKRLMIFFHLEEKIIS